VAEDENPTPAPDASVLAYWEGTFSAPAFFASQTAVLDIGVGVRVSFAESLGTNSSPVWTRVAVALADFQAYQLWEQLGNSEAVKRVQKFVAEQQANAAET